MQPLRCVLVLLLLLLLPNAATAAPAAGAGGATAATAACLLLRVMLVTFDGVGDVCWWWWHCWRQLTLSTRADMPPSRRTATAKELPCGQYTFGRCANPRSCNSS